LSFKNIFHNRIKLNITFYIKGGDMKDLFLTLIMSVVVKGYVFLFGDDEKNIKIKKNKQQGLRLRAGGKY